MTAAFSVLRTRLANAVHHLSGSLAPPLAHARQRLSSVAQELAREVSFCRAVYADRRTPWKARALLWLALAYAALPVDLIPDFLPVVGQLDDMVIVPGLILLALRLVPRDVYRHHRSEFFQDDRARPGNPRTGDGAPDMSA